MNSKFVIISAPSGAGKTTIVHYLLESDLALEFSVSATTRNIRENEKDRRDYYFISINEFKKKIERGEFAEWQEVYKDNFYGTPLSEIERIGLNGNHALFDVDVVGGINLKKFFGAGSVSIFIMPPSISILEKRLVARATDKPEKIRMRLMKAEKEMKSAGSFDHIVINDNLEKAKAETYKIVSDFLLSA